MCKIKQSILYLTQCLWYLLTEYLSHLLIPYLRHFYNFMKHNYSIISNTFSIPITLTNTCARIPTIIFLGCAILFTITLKLIVFPFWIRITCCTIQYFTNVLTLFTLVNILYHLSLFYLEHTFIGDINSNTTSIISTYTNPECIINFNVI